MRDCSLASFVWSNLISSNERSNFFGFHFLEWVSYNLQMDVGGKRDGNCSAFWDQNCYFMWLWRNKHEHKDDFIRPLKPWEVILKACDEYSNGVVVHVMASGNTSSEVMIG